MRKWQQLILGILFICGFVYTVPKLFFSIPAAKNIQHQIEEKGINADALFYSEEEATDQAEEKVRNSVHSK